MLPVPEFQDVGISIILFGQKGHGKTEFAKAFVQEFNKRLFFNGNLDTLKLVKSKDEMRHLSFATPLKGLLAKILNVSKEEIEEHKNDKEPFRGCQCTVRVMLEQLGMLMRQFKPDIFVMEAFKLQGNVIVDDGRLDSELQAANDLAFNTILIYRPDALNRRPTSQTEEDMLKYYEMIESDKLEEASERFCGIVKNSGTLTDLRIDAVSYAQTVVHQYIEQLKQVRK